MNETGDSASFVSDDRACIHCSYNLKGLPLVGVCSECGAPIAESLRGILLAFAAPEYLQTLRRGLSLILNSILLSVVLGVAGAFVPMLLARTGASSIGAMTLVQVANLIPTAMYLAGYWMFSEPDPGYVGHEGPHAARRVLRVSAVVSVGLTLAQSVLTLANGPSVSPMTLPTGSLASLFTFSLVVLVIISTVTQFFASMLYTKWVGSRVPDEFIVKRAKTYLWLLPVLYFPGMCLVIGPLIALVLYWNLLDRLRKHVKAIIATGGAANTPPRMLG